MVTPSHPSLLNSLSDAFSHGWDPPTLQALAARDCITSLKSSSRASNRQDRAGQTARFWRRAGLRCSAVGKHLGPARGVKNVKKWGDPDICRILLPWQSTDKGGSLRSCALLVAPGLLSSSQRNTLGMPSACFIRSPF